MSIAWGIWLPEKKTWVLSSNGRVIWAPCREVIKVEIENLKKAGLPELAGEPKPFNKKRGEEMSQDNWYFTQRCIDWVQRALGEKILTDKRERAMRFIEEALEAAQACGLSESDVFKITERVYTRPVGQVGEELAGTFFTLLVLAHSRGISLDFELMKELKRVDTPEMIAHIREKHSGKVALGIGTPIADKP